MYPCHFCGELTSNDSGICDDCQKEIDSHPLPPINEPSDDPEPTEN